MSIEFSIFFFGCPLFLFLYLFLSFPPSLFLLPFPIFWVVLVVPIFLMHIWVGNKQKSNLCRFFYCFIIYWNIFKCRLNDLCTSKPRKQKKRKAQAQNTHECVDWCCCFGHCIPILAIHVVHLFGACDFAMLCHVLPNEKGRTRENPKRNRMRWNRKRGTFFCGPLYSVIFQFSFIAPP